MNVFDRSEHVKPENSPDYKPTLSVLPPVRDLPLKHAFQWMLHYCRLGWEGLTLEHRGHACVFLNVTDEFLTKELCDEALVYKLICMGFNKKAIAEFSTRPETRLRLDNLDELYKRCLKKARALYRTNIAGVPNVFVSRLMRQLTEDDPRLPLHERRESLLLMFYLRAMAAEEYPSLIYQFEQNQWPWFEDVKAGAVYTRTSFCVELAKDYCRDRDYTRLPTRVAVLRDFARAISCGDPWIWKPRILQRIPVPGGPAYGHATAWFTMWNRDWLIKHQLWHPVPDSYKPPNDKLGWYKIPIALGKRVVSFPELQGNAAGTEQPTA